MNGIHQRIGRSVEKATLIVTSIGVLILVFFIVEGIGEAAQIPAFQSPIPTSTFTPTPVPPTNTPTPVPPTDTPTPVPPTDTPTPVPPTDTPVPPTPTDTPVPPTPTDTPVPPTDTPVPNSPPAIDLISGPADPVDIDDQPVTVDVVFSDPDSGDTHTLTWDWGDGSLPDGPSNATSPTSNSHTYAETGIYGVQVTVTDAAGASDSDSYEFIVIFDPGGGFVTGGGWIDSPVGAYNPHPSLTGKATFGFVSAYKRGASVPTGNTQFQFKTGDLNFQSESYEWLVVTKGGASAQFKGEGTVNGMLDPNGNAYKFMLWAGDGSPDTFRIKIWFEVPPAESVLYDNGSQDPIGGGSIVIHRGG